MRVAGGCTECGLQDVQSPEVGLNETDVSRWEGSGQVNAVCVLLQQRMLVSLNASDECMAYRVSLL